MNELKNKGQVSSLVPAILGLVFAAVVLVFGVMMSQELRDTTTGSVSHTSVNESITAWSGTTTNKSLSGRVECGFGSVTTSSVEVYNATNSYVIASGNYTVYSNGYIVNKTIPNANIREGWKVTYTYTNGGEACTSGNKTVTGLGTFADFWEIIVLAIVISVVIGLLLVVFGGRKGR